MTPAQSEARRRERASLIERARLLEVALSDDMADRLGRLLDELERWNAAYNLTSIRRRGEMVTHHLLDSLSLHRFLRGERIADVGTGAGFPGLPLAIVNPERQFTLVDSNGKKTRFVTHAARTLGLGNVTVLHARAEDLRPQRPFDTVTARAVGELYEVMRNVIELCDAHTRVLAMKGRYPRMELEAIGPPWRILETRTLEVPGVEAERHLVMAERVMIEE